KFAVLVVDIALRLLELAREEGGGVLGHCLAKLEVFFQQHGRKPTTDVLRFLRAACRKVHINPGTVLACPGFFFLVVPPAVGGVRSVSTCSMDMLARISSTASSTVLPFARPKRSIMGCSRLRLRTCCSIVAMRWPTSSVTTGLT